ncbi:hypothetical protein OEA41_000520 [Lepraria neglecta]|uniref:Uncharacterized protein n=1 Tax=Lepraria neglecta TaxID=209136 RepID=A0AAD9ZG50_9LECA|nr:hypothetical protein OEA41_000520 [Lepraria neglecta]
MPRPSEKHSGTSKPKHAGEQCDKGAILAQKKSNNPKCPPTHHVLHHIWTTKRDTEKRAESKQSLDSDLSPAMQRWMREPMRDQPWHGVRTFSVSPPSKGKYVVKGETGSNSAVEGTVEPKDDGPHV